MRRLVLQLLDFTLEAMVMVCIVLICYSSLRGNFDEALTHIRNGFYLSISDIDYDQSRGHVFDEKEWHPVLCIHSNSPLIPLLQVEIGDDVVMPIQTIIFKTESHD